MTKRGPGRGRAVLTTALLAVALLAAGGCGRERADRAAAPAGQVPATTTGAPAPATPPPAPGGAPAAGTPAGETGGVITQSDNGLTPIKGGARFSSPEAGFSAVFPAGCPRITTRTFPGGPNAGSPEIVQCFCDLTGRRGEGAMVATYLTLRDERGGPPNPRNVTKLIEDLTQKFQLRIVRQATVTRPDYEGVRLFCRDAGGQGEMWVQGMLAGDRAYIMTAWRPAGGGISDTEAAGFFESFQIQR